MDNLPTITNKQLEILLHFYKFRFLNTNQIQKLMKHKNPQGIQEWLKDLTQKQYLKQSYSRKTFADKMTPAIYSLTLLARKKLKKVEKCEISVLDRIYREKTSSQAFIEHNLLIAEIYLLLLVEKEDKLHFFTRTDLVGYKYLPTRKQLDAYIAIKEGKSTRRFFLKIVGGEIPWYALKANINKYFEYEASGEWQGHANNSPLPTILLVCPDKKREEWLFGFIKKRLEEEIFGLAFFLTTKENIKLYEQNKDIWQKVV